MAKEAVRRRRLYRRLRKQLVRDMGGRCAACGYRWRLEFNHLYLRTWWSAKTSRLQRLRNYRREWREGLLNLLCTRCNKKPENRPREYPPGYQEEEFV